jgi:phosphomannomutase
VAGLIISVSGLRGVIGSELDPLVAMRYAAAFVSGLPAGPVVVTRDGRATGAMLARAVHSAITALGHDVIDAGIAATPTIGVLVREAKAVGGIQVSASHNPPQYNGLKLLSSEGCVISAEAGQEVLDRYQADDIAWTDHEKIANTMPAGDTLAEHARLVLDTVDVARIRERKFRVVLDSNRGAGSLLGQYLLRELGCDVTCLGDTPDGQFEHPAEPTQENLGSVLQQVVTAGADVGFCQDPDADRLAVIDEAGRYVGEEYTLALCLDHVLRQQSGPVVTNCSSSRMSEDLAIKYHAPFYRSAVGEANVTGKMREVGAVFGGEGNGGPIDPRVGYIRDSFVGMAQILDAMASRERRVSELADELPQYAIHKTKFTIDQTKTAAILDALADQFDDAQSDRMDGLRLDWPGKWLLVRASNTEPIVRAIAEAADPQEAQRLCEVAGQVITSASETAQ